MGRRMGRHELVDRSHHPGAGARARARADPGTRPGAGRSAASPAAAASSSSGLLTGLSRPARRATRTT